MEEIGKISVLVVEDSLSWQEIYRELLGSAGYLVTIADSREDAIRNLDQKNYDIIIVDLALPEKSGVGKPDFEHGLAILDHAAKLDSTPKVLAVTGRDRKTFPIDIKVLEKGVDTGEVLLENVKRLAIAKGVEEEIWQVAGKLSSIALDLNGALKILLERIKELTGAKVGHILFPVENELRVFVGTGQEPLGFAVPISHSLTGRAFTTHNVINVPDVEKEELYIPGIGNRMKSELATPLIDSGKVVGVLNLESDVPQAFGELEEKIAFTVAELIVVTLGNEQHKQELKQANRELEEARKGAKMAGVGELSGDVVHQMNSPLAAIKLNIQLIQDNCRAELGNDYLANKLQEISKINDEALEMIRRMKERAHTIILEPVDVIQTMKLALSDVRIPPDIKVINYLDDLEPLPNVQATQQLIVVFRNLIDNAISAMPNGGELKINTDLVEDNWLDLTVEDNGIGIPDEWREQIFNILSVFSKRSDGRGQGLGLWYSRAYLEACGGELPPPHSEVGKGTKFTARLLIHNL